MNNLKVFGKFLDQPLLIAKFQKKVPLALMTGAGILAYHEIKKENSDNKKTKAIKLFSVLTCTVASALLAPKFVNKIFKIKTKNLKTITNEIGSLNKNFLNKNTSIDDKTNSIIRKSEKKILKFSEIKHLYKNLDTTDSGKQYLESLIPAPQNISSKEIFSEIGRLSLLGFIPVIGGILGGIVGDRLTEKNWKEFLPNKIKEGAYQYLANIFLCNIGAGTALALMEKAHVTSKNKRALGMVGGILTTGVFGGSAIANFIGNKIINPVFGNKDNKSLFAERKPEALDIGLHTDDIATVAVMSGLKWIEPALPIMYAISGYRAGIGYRNGGNLKENHPDL